jgi:integrase
MSTALKPRKPTASDPWDRLLDRWMDSSRARGNAALTLKKYLGPVRRELIPFLRSRGITDPKQIGRDLMDPFTAHLLDTPNLIDGRPRSSQTVRSYVASANRFLAWLHDVGETGGLVAATKPRKQAARQVKDIVRPAEYRALKEEAGRQEAKRDLLLLKTLYGTGARADEIATAKVGGLVQKEQGFQLMVWGKTAGHTGSRSVPIDPDLWRELRDYARGKGADEPIFTAKIRSKRTRRLEALTADGIGQMIAGLCAEINARQEEEGGAPFRRVGPQRFRRAYASRMSKYMDINSLATVMGTSPKVLEEFYVSRTDSDLYEGTMRALKLAEEAERGR